MLIDQETAFTQLALKDKIIAREQLRECQKEQSLLRKKGKLKHLREIMLAKDFITAEQAEKLLEEVKKSGANRIDDFEILAKVGQGGMGVVYKALQISTDKLVALKTLPLGASQNKETLQRFYRESEACIKSDHPNIVRGIAVGQADGQHYLAMEYIEGGTLRDVLRKDGHIPYRRGVEMMMDIVKALIYAHDSDLIHRDVKPGNILLTKEGEAKLADLGLSKHLSEDSLSLTVSGVGMGTTYYVPPEQMLDAKTVDHRCDIYSLGATFYYALTGKRPYEGTPLEILRKHRTEKLTPAREINPEIPEALSLIIQKMMAKDPGKRYQSASEILDHLMAFKRMEAKKTGQPQEAVEAEQIPKRTLGDKAARGEEKEKASAERHHAKPKAPTPKPIPPKTSHAQAQLGQTGERWYVKFRKPDGMTIMRDYDLDGLRQRIERGRIGPRTAVRKGSDGSFKMAQDYSELSDTFADQADIVQRAREAAKQTPAARENMRDQLSYAKKVKQMDIIIKVAIVGVVVLTMIAIGCYLLLR